MKNYEPQEEPRKKVNLSNNQYVYNFQLKFIANLIADHNIPVSYYKKSIVSYSLYNFINDYLKDTDPKAGYFYWDHEEEEFNFETNDDALCEAIASAGYVDVWDEIE